MNHSNDKGQCQKGKAQKDKGNNLPGSNTHNDMKEPNNEKRFREAFNAVDSNFDGRITMIELKEAFAKLGNHVSDDEVQRMIRGADLDNNGTVEFEEFVQLMKRFKSNKLNKMKSTDTEAYEVFKAFDHNGDDMLDFNEIKSTMIALGEQVTDEDVRAMIIEADLDRNGKIDFSEFKRIMVLYQKKAIK